MPTWTNPTTWIDGYLMGASAMNIYVRDNMNALMNPNNFVLQGLAAFSTTATTLATLTSTALVVQGGGPVLVAGQLPLQVSNSHSALVVIDIDGTQQTIYSGQANGGSYGIVPFNTLWTGLSVASHTVSVKWKVDAGNQTATTTGANLPVVPVSVNSIEL